MYPDSGTSRHQSRAKSPPSILLLRALRPGAAHPGDGFGAPENVRLVLYNTHFFTRGYDTPAVILLLITLAGDVESNPGPPKIYTCPICSQHSTSNKKCKGSVLCISCKDWVHTTCTTLTNTKQYTNTWTCTKCNAQATPPVTTPLALSTTNITPVRPTITPTQQCRATAHLTAHHIHNDPQTHQHQH